MKYPECAITGCEFFSPAEGKFVHGDLHKVGRAYVFNAVIHRTNEAVWQYGVPRHASNVISCAEGAYFERRGIITFDEASAEMNETAFNYCVSALRPAHQKS